MTNTTVYTIQFIAGAAVLLSCLFQNQPLWVPVLGVILCVYAVIEFWLYRDVP